MTKKKNLNVESDRTTKLLRDLIIIQLGLAGVGQKEIRTIVGGDMNEINRIVKMLRPKSNQTQKADK